MTVSEDNPVRRFLVIVFGLFVFTSTFSIAVSQMMLGLSLALFIVVLFRERYDPFPKSLKLFYIAVVIWVGWLYLTAILGDTPLRSLALSREEWLFVAVMIGVYVLREPKARLWMMTALAGGVLLVTAYGLLQYFFGVGWFSSFEVYPAPGFGYRVGGMFSHVGTFGNYYAVAAATLMGFAVISRSRVTGGHRVLFLSSAVGAALMTILSFSRGPLVALVGTVIVFLIFLGRKYKFWSMGIIAAMIVVAMAVPGISNRFVGEFKNDIGGTYEGGRMFVWKNSIKVIEEHPLFGVGQGNFRTEYIKHLRPDIHKSRKLTHAHNDALNVAAVSGFPGLAAFGFMWLVSLWYFWTGYRHTREHDPERSAYYMAALLGSICFLGTSLTEATFVDEEIRQLLMFVWSLGLFGWYKSVRVSGRWRPDTQTS